MIRTSKLLLVLLEIFKLNAIAEESHFFFSEKPYFVKKPPTSVTVKEKETVTLPCEENGFPQPVITWYKDERLIEEDRKHFGKKDLILKESEFKDRGLFTCRAENLLGIAEVSTNVTVKGKNV